MSGLANARGMRDDYRRKLLSQALELANNEDLVECIEAEIWFRCLNLKIGDAGNSDAECRMLACREAVMIVKQC